MNFVTRALGWGVVIYAVMYLLWSGLVLYGLAAGVASLILRIGALAVVTTLAARTLHIQNWKDLAPYTVSWALITIALDALYLVPYSGWALYGNGSVWVGYTLVALIPLLTVSYFASSAKASRLS